MMLSAIIFIAMILFLGHHWYKNRKSLLTNWPVLGMLPSLILNSDRIYDFFSHDLLDFSEGATFKFKGPWFPSLDFVLTSNPMNANHTLNKNFVNYEKGSEFREIFQPFGAGIVTLDSDPWKSQRRNLHAIMVKSNKYMKYQDVVFRHILEKKLVPVLEHAVTQGTEVDLEDILQRFDYDNICLLALGFDPKSLSVSFPKVPSKVAFHDIEDCLLFRYVVPISVWKILKRLQIGSEKRLSKALEIADHFVYDCISMKREKLRKNTAVDDDEFDVLTAFLVDGENISVPGEISDKFLRDTTFNFLAAGKDTVNACLSWFFWLISINPSVKTKILQEIESNIHTSYKDRNTVMHFTAEELTGFTYLHAALCETLRLYPPVPVNHKNAVGPDVLPSGDSVDRDTRILVSNYSIGRNREIWGKDCLEFKPERWISDKGEIVHVPTYKFPVFGAGPRSCLGKDMSMKQMKIVAINLLGNYQVEVVEGQIMKPGKCISLHIANGLKVRIKRRLA